MHLEDGPGPKEQSTEETLPITPIEGGEGAATEAPTEEKDPVEEEAAE